MDAESTRDTPPARSAALWLWAAAGVGSVLFVALALSYRHRVAVGPWSSLGQGLPLDDAWIHVQFALNAARGAFFQFNPGTYSSGSTAPLWSLLEGLGLTLVHDPVAVAHFLGVIFTLAAVVASVMLARRIGLEGVSLLAVPLLLVVQWRLIWASLSGMEVPLAAFLAVLWCVVYLGERRSGGLAWRSGLIAGLLVWTRPEGLIAGVIMVIDQVVLLARDVDGSPGPRQRAWRAVSATAALAAVVGPLFAINAAIGPGIFPQTVYTKAHAVELGQGFRLLLSFFMELSVDHLTWHLFFLGAVVFSAARLVVARRGEAVAVLFVVAYMAAIAFLRGSTDHHGRYLMPCIPILVVLGADGLARAARALSLGKAGLLAGALALAYTASPSVREGAEEYALNVASVSGHVVAMGRWIDRHLPRDATLAMSDVGAMSALTPNRVVDMRGLISPYFGWDRLAELDRERREGVAYALLFPELNERVILRGHYVPIHVITLDANNISATDNLVVYRTPWTDQRVLRPVGRSFDFEDGTLQGWTTSGVLSQGPVEGAGQGQRRVIDLGGGRYFLSSWGDRGDADAGWAVSPELPIEGDIMTLRIGGGQIPGHVGVRLWVDGHVVRTAVGPRSEVLVVREWDLRDLRGRRARIELFDDTAEGWGHVMLDEVHQFVVESGQPPLLRDFPLEGPQEPEASQRAATLP